MSRGIGGKRRGAGQGEDGAAGSRSQTGITTPGTVLRRFNFRYGALPFVDVAKLSAAHGVHPAETRAGRAQPYTSLSLRLDPSSSAAMLIDCPSLDPIDEGVVRAGGNGSLGWCSELSM